MQTKIYLFSKEEQIMKHSSSKCALTNVKRGQRMTISVISNCWSMGAVTLKDDTKTYAIIDNDEATNKHQLLGIDSKKYNGGKNLRVEIEIDSNYDINIKQSVSNTNMVNSAGKIIGNIYTIAIEDLTDNEYNDFVITVLVTNK